MRKLYVTALIAGVILYACSNKDALPQLNVNQQQCDSIPATYINDVKPILSTNCAIKDCHGLDAAAGIDLSTYETARANANTGKFVKAIRHESGATPMPKNAQQLSKTQINTIECWILNDFPQ